MSDPCARMHLPENDPGRFARWRARRESISRSLPCGNFPEPANSWQTPITPNWYLSPDRGRETITSFRAGNRSIGHAIAARTNTEYSLQFLGEFRCGIGGKRSWGEQENDDSGRSNCWWWRRCASGLAACGGSSRRCKAPCRASICRQRRLSSARISVCAFDPQTGQRQRHQFRHRHAQFHRRQRFCRG